MKLLKKWYLPLPLLVFPVLLIPYSYLNQSVIVDAFGCGCPKTDEAGNILVNTFNANDFTRIFWTVIALGTIIASLFLMKKLPKVWMKAVYVALVAIVSLLLAAWFSRIMMWE